MEERTPWCVGITCNPWPLYSNPAEQDARVHEKQSIATHYFLLFPASTTYRDWAFLSTICCALEPHQLTPVMSCAQQGKKWHTFVLFSHDSERKSQQVASDSAARVQLSGVQQQVRSASHGCLCRLFQPIKKLLSYLPAPGPSHRTPTKLIRTDCSIKEQRNLLRHADQ